MNYTILALLLGITSIASAQTARGWYDKALATKDYNEKVDYYTKAIELQSNFGLAYYGRATAHNQLRDYEAAIKDFTATLNYKPGYARAYNGRGFSYLQLREYQKAVKDLNKAIRLKPSNATAYNYRGNAHTKLEEYSKAIADYTEAIKLKPSYFVAYNSRGHAYIYQNCYSNAIKDFDKAIQINPKFYQAYSNRANAKQRLRKYDEAMADYDMALSIKPSYPPADQGKTMVLASRDNYPEEYFHVRWVGLDSNYIDNYQDSVYTIELYYQSDKRVDENSFVVFINQDTPQDKVTSRRVKESCEKNWGYFYSTIILKEGENTIQVVGRNASAVNESLYTLYINYVPKFGGQ